MSDFDVVRSSLGFSFITTEDYAQALAALDRIEAEYRSMSVQLTEAALDLRNEPPSDSGT
mgnify:CR=1 FL=1